MAEWKAIKIHEIVRDINDNKIVLPVIQRNLVWDEEKMELLFDSLLKGNSFGGIMALEEEGGSQPLFAFRRFSKEGEIHDSDLPSVLDHNTTLIIDGQQRLQTFYMGLKGGVNGKTLYFNLFSQVDYEFEYAGQVNDLPLSRTEDSEEVQYLWYPVQTLYSQLARSGGDDFQIAKEIITIRNIQNDKQKELIVGNVKRFERAIFGFDTLGISIVHINKTDPDGERRRMVELFRRLNDGGTRLSAVELVASILKGFDYRLEAFLRRDIPAYQDIGFGQDEVIKLIFLLQDNAAKEVTDIIKADADFAINNTPRILKTLDVLRQLLKDLQLYEYYRDGGRSVISLYFIAYHIFHNPAKTEALSGLYANYDANNPDFTNIKRWLYLSLLNGVFSRGRGWTPYRTGIRKILNVVRQYRGALFPADELFAVYEAHPLIFSRQVSVDLLPTWDMTFIFYLIYGCRSLTGRDIDHIQPKSLLSQAGVAPEKIHSISNYQLLDVGSNRDAKRAKKLKDWLGGWTDTDLDVHLIPKNPALWELEKFDEFLAERARVIKEKIEQTIPRQSVKSQLAAQPTFQPEQTMMPRTPDNYPGAAWLKKEQRDPEAWLSGYADHRGNGQEFRQIVEAARSVGLHARFQNNWWVVKFTPPKNRQHGLIELATSLSIYIHPEHIAAHVGCPAELVREKLMFAETLQHADVPRWIENFTSLFAKK